MCGRFNVIDEPLEKLIQQITGSRQGWPVATELNLAPSAQVPVLRLDADQGWQLTSMRWWLVPSWSTGPSSKYSMFNARSETLRKSRAYAKPLQRQRCIVPITSYFEWQRTEGKKQPYLISPEQAPGLALAGLWDSWAGKGEVVESCTIITAESPDPMKWLHHRMPVQLVDEEAGAWLAPEVTDSEIDRLLRSELKLDLLATPVTSRVNNARNRDSGCLEPLGDPVPISSASKPATQTT